MDAGRPDHVPACRSARWRILPLGDSITESETSYRGHLYKALVEAGYDVDFVGSRRKAPLVSGDPDHEGRGGHTIGPDESAFCRWNPTRATHDCSSYRFNIWDNLDDVLSHDADMILLLIGINDLFPAHTPEPGKDGVLRSPDPKAAPDKLERLVLEIARRKRNAHVLVSSLVRLRDTDGRGWPEYQAMNARARAMSEASATDNVLFVDLNAIPMSPADFVDGVHPSDSGGAKTAKLGWLPALLPLLGAPQLPGTCTAPVEGDDRVSLRR